jgi:hypothetical protein
MVELPDDLVRKVRQHSVVGGKTFENVLVEALELLIRAEKPPIEMPQWEALYGNFSADDMAEVQDIVSSMVEKVSTVIAEKVSTSMVEKVTTRLWTSARSSCRGARSAGL